MRYIVWSVLLFLGYTSRSVTYPELCFPVYYDHENSGSQPDIPYLGSYTMFQEFCIKNSTANLTTNFTQNATWSYDHHNLSDSNHYHINNPLRPYWKDGQQCVNSSLTLLNVTGQDHGVYTVVVSTNCGSQNYTNFTLQFSPCDEPRPVNPTQKPVIVSDLNRPPSLTFRFQGDSKTTDYIFHLMIMKSGEENKTCSCTLCISKECDCENMHIHCDQNIAQCSTTLSVQFHNFTTQDTGKYCVVPSLLGSGSSGNMLCVELDVQQTGQALVVPLATSLGIGVVIVVIGIIVVVVCKKRRKCGDKEPLLTNETTADYHGGRHGHVLSQSYGLSHTHTTGAHFGSRKAAVGIDTESDSIRDSSQTKNGTTPRDCEALWQKLPNIVLNTSQLQKVSEQLNRWEPLGRALGLKQSDITEIQENNPRNYEEQRYQMLFKWSQREKQASLQSLVQCVEVVRRDRELAEKIVAALDLSETKIPPSFTHN